MLTPRSLAPAEPGALAERMVCGQGDGHLSVCVGGGRVQGREEKGKGLGALCRDGSC